MLAFRKWFLALALVTLTMAVASAQTVTVPAFQCVANAGVPPLVRAEGIAELVGDLVLNCTGGVPAGMTVPNGPTGPASIPLINVQVFLDVNVTSKLYETTNNSSEALLMIDEPVDAAQRICQNTVGTGSCYVPPRPGDPGGVYKQPYLDTTPDPDVMVQPYNVFQGRVQGANSVAWLGVPIDAPGTVFTRIIRMTNIRGNANMKGVSSTLVPSQIIAYISATGTTSVPINNPQQTVAWIQKGLTYSARQPDGDSGAETYRQCASHNGDQYSDPLKTDYACATNRLRFDEGFASAWKTRFDGGPVTGNNQNNPGSVYTMSESGFFRFTDNAISGWGSLAGTAGVASQGTRLRVAFNNIPAGIRAFVSLHPGGYDSTKDAVLVNTAPDGSGAYVPVPKSASAKTSGCTWTSVHGYDMAEIPIFGGSGVATWEVISTSSLVIERMEFALFLAWKANTTNNLPGLGTVTTNGSFAPLSTITTASTVAPTPRFADTSSALNTTVIEQCVTNLLFPYVTNVPGWDTGLVISNTTKDPWGHATEAGTCELNYYGDVAGGPPPPQQVSGVVPAGDYLAWGLSSGGKFGVTATPGFQGYIIARCKFRYAHGYAFISDLGAQRVANGYLALVMDTHSARSDVSTSENLGN
jgi:hypothetical protein